MNKTRNTSKYVKMPEADVLALAAAKLKGRVLFPEKLEMAKKFLRTAKVKTP